ncbi:tRNA (adenosine(37)-N6)-dimethylallyltransferase MiaA [Alienimonas chondri]|uniref:tRNA dimethylallyltransferase n=1 Tax=Alienimonas chondri TaxID=2681879 RepID=A0ABX1VHQ1_9PLAN|nr:tRNA (adenosine(37)-N6)-dimethylallyltransferase MiaA [Alienimonas chondri]NNJ27642.1 tRNA dimethylallyltransferase [Alienimonas chondri]
MPPELLRRCRILAGPTACGKSAAALQLAERWDAEILSLDSMAVFRGMDVGTAKPTAAERAAVPHHLLDLAEPTGTFSVARYLEHAETVVRDVLSRGKVPLFVGGTAFYLRSLLRGLGDVPAGDAGVRAELEAEIAERGPEALHATLAAVDPAAAAGIYTTDARRIVRALEVIRLTGAPFSASRPDDDPLPPQDRPVLCVWLDPPRAVRWDRIHRRIDCMLAEGLVEEVKRLRTDPGLGTTARQGLGYKEVLDHLEEGEPLERCVERLKTRTRQFSKRQCTFFRGLPECVRVPLTGDEDAAMVAAIVDAFPH